MLPGQVDKQVLATGVALFKEGDPGDAAFIVESGSIVIRKEASEGTIDLATLGPGELFGEMAIIDGSPRMAAAAVAAEDTIVVRVPRPVFEAKIEAYDPFLQALVKILVNNLRNVQREYMRRPRSVQDYVTVMSNHASGLRTYFSQLQELDPEAEAFTRLDALDKAIKALAYIFASHDDRRKSVITDSDLNGGLMREDGNSEPQALE